MLRRYIQRPFLTVLLLLSATVVCAQTMSLRNIADIPHLSAYLVAGLMIAVFVMFFSNRLYFFKEREITGKSQQLNAQLALILNTNKTTVWTYDIQKRVFRVLSSEGTSETEYVPIDFSQFFNHDDFAILRKVIATVSDSGIPSEAIIVKGKTPTDETTKQKLYEISVSVLRKDKKDQPHVLLGIQNDITDEKERLEESQKLSLRYHTVFNTSLIDMVYYDADGIMTDINDKACETFAVEDRQKLLATRPSINDVPAMQGIDFHAMDQMHSSSITELEHIDKPIGGVDQNYWGNKIYYEQTMSPIRNKDGELTGIVMAGRNITEMVQSQHYQQWASRQLEKTTKDIQSYIDNINYSLKVSDVRLINYYPATHELEVSSDLNKTQLRLSQLRAITLVSEDDRSRAKSLFFRMDRRRPGIINDTLHTLLHDHEGRDVYLNFNVMPLFDKDGRVTHYFGMCRNETELTYTEMRLQEETEKAQETEQLKNTFLLNMSYELRTPLSAVVGFAELFNNEHSEEDEPIFAEEIKKNTNVLLQLINDILFISRLDAHMIEFDYQECDFATMFEGWCYMGWSAMESNVKAVVENPYSRLIVKIDSQNLAMVIEKLCTYSCSTTTEGMLRAKYEYRQGELMITIDDTGRGLSAEALPKAFDRFVREEGAERQGTGLDLPIVKELVEQMGGTIELQSEWGKGTTFLVNIPCEMKSLEKRKEMITR